MLILIMQKEYLYIYLYFIFHLCNYLENYKIFMKLLFLYILSVQALQTVILLFTNI